MSETSGFKEPEGNKGSKKRESKNVLIIFAILILSLGVFALIFVFFIRQPKNESDDSFETISPPPGTWLYGGSTTWAPIRDKVDSQIRQTHPNFNIVYTRHPSKPDGSGTGIAMLLNDQLSFSQSSRSLKDREYTQAQHRQFTLMQIPVAIDAIVIVVHPELTVDSLSLEQIKDIYVGKITNWQELGGTDLPIVPITRPPKAGGTPEFFVEHVLEGENFASNVEFTTTTTLALRKVSQNLGGIYYGSAPEVIDQCTIKPLPIQVTNTQLIAPYAGERVLQDNCPEKRNQFNLKAMQEGKYPLTRRLFVIIKKNEVDEPAGRAYANMLLTHEGQKLIGEAGFIPLRLELGSE